MAEAAFYRFHSRHKRGAHGTNARDQDPQLTFRGRNPGISYGGQLRISLSGTRMLKCTLEQGCRRLSFGILTFYGKARDFWHQNAGLY